MKRDVQTRVQTGVMQVVSQVGRQAKNYEQHPAGLRAPDVDGRSRTYRVLCSVSMVPRGVFGVRAEQQHRLAEPDGALKGL